jgi:hypothetical protein
MTQRKPLKYEVTATTTATTTSDWFNLDYRYDQNSDRSFFITQASVSNQTMTLQVAGAVPASAGDSSIDVYNVSVYTGSSADGVLIGNWPAVRVIARANNGTAKFVMMG